MNSQPFDPFDPYTLRENPPPPPDRPDGTSGRSPFFDRGGVAWILACVAIAAAAGHWIPQFTEPATTKPVAAAKASARPAPPHRQPPADGAAQAPAQSTAPVAPKLAAGVF